MREEFKYNNICIVGFLALTSLSAKNRRGERLKPTQIAYQACSYPRRIGQQMTDLSGFVLGKTATKARSSCFVAVVPVELAGINVQGCLVSLICPFQWCL